MKAVSLWQPWASAIAHGYKRFETRSWAFPRSLAGQRIAIHAAKRWTAEEKEDLQNFRAQGIAICPEEVPPLGCIVAVATLAECLTGDQALRTIQAKVQQQADNWEFEERLGWFGPDRYAWLLTNVNCLPTPVPCKGAQGFFDLTPETRRLIADSKLGRTLVLPDPPAVELPHQEDDSQFTLF